MWRWKRILLIKVSSRRPSSFSNFSAEDPGKQGERVLNPPYGIGTIASHKFFPKD
jgi:hypothetical protein